MKCGPSCLQMIFNYYGLIVSNDTIDSLCYATREGVSLLSLQEVALNFGFKCTCLKISYEKLVENMNPCILHWNQNHFVVLYKVRDKKKFYVADPAKGLICYSLEDFKKHWISSVSAGEEKGIVMFLEPTETFSKIRTANQYDKRRSFNFLVDYLLQYRIYFVQIILGLLLGCLLQLIMPFLTQAIVDIGIKHNDIGFIWLVLFGELMIIVGRTATDFIRRWLLLHISMRINISLISDFFIKLLKLPWLFSIPN